MRYWLFTFLCFVTACSGDDDKPLVVKNPEAGNGSGAEAGEGNGTGGSSTGTGGNGGTSGSGNTGGLGNPDPEEVYLLGSLALSRPDLMALCHWTTPDDYAAGFADIVAYKAKIGQAGLIYQVDSRKTELRRFVPDLVSSSPLESITYPEDPAQNDPVVAELECPGGTFVLHFVVGPADRIVYLCGGEGWFENGELVYDGLEDMLALGHDDLAVVSESGVGHFVVNLASGEKIQIEDIGTIYAARAIPDGFLVAGIGADGDELWEVFADGRPMSRGLYTPQDPGSFRYFWALDADGVLYELDQVGQPETILTRRRVGGSNEIVVSDLEPGNVFISGHGLVTGP